MTTTEIQAAVEKLNQAFTAFQASNDERYEQIKAGFDDVIKKEEVDRINNEISKMQDYIKELENAAARPALGGGESAGKDIVSKARDFFAMTKEGANSDDTILVEKYNAYRKAFVNGALRMWNMEGMSPEIHNAMRAGSDPAGGYLVPVEMSNVIQTRIFETSPVRRIASTINIGSKSIKFMNDTNEALSGGWVGETTAPEDTGTPDVGEQEIFAHTQYAQPKVTQELLEDAAVDIETWLINKVADKLSRVENAAFVSGNGVLKPRGFLDYKNSAVTTKDSARAWGVLQYVPSGAAGGFPKASGGALPDDANCFIDLIQSLKPDYRTGAVFTMNRTMEAAIRKLRDADGRHLVGMGDLQNGINFRLHNYEIVNLEDMPDPAGNSFSVAFGNFRTGYQIVDRLGITLLRDPYTNKPYIKFYFRKRVGGDVVNFDAIKLLKLAAS